MGFAAGLFLLVIGILSNNFRKYSLIQSEKLTQSYAQQSANRAQAILEQDMSAMRTLADAFSVYRSIPMQVRKPVFEEMMRRVLLNHPKYLSVWISWELSSIDDNWYKNHGRQRTLVLRNPDGTTTTIIDSMELQSESYGSTYYKLKTSKDREFIVNPYFYTYESDEYSDSILETSIAVQVREGDEYRALIGIDVKLSRLQDIIKTQIPFDSASMILVANDGTLVAHKNEDYIGLSVKTILGEEYTKADILNKIEKGKLFSVTTIDSIDFTESFTSFVPFRVGESKTPWSVAVSVPVNIITQEAYSNFFYSLLLGFIGFVLLAAVIFILSANITRPLMRTVSLLHRLERGEVELLTDRSMARKDEIGEMSRSVRKLLEKLNDTVEFAHKVGEGNFHIDYKPDSKKDKLGYALANMQKNLSNIDEERSNREKENQRNIWLQKGITQIGEIIQDNYSDLQSLTEPVIKFIVKYVNVPQAAFFVSQYKYESLQSLVLSSAYAYGRKKNIQDEYEPGEGLVGRCAEEQKTISLSDIPDNYSYISSGLGKEKPHFLMLVPLIYDRKTQGVLEVASFKELLRHEKEFLEVSAERIASEILNISNNIETQKILKQLEKQSSMMAEKEKENISVIEKLEKAKNVLNEQRFENKQIVDALSSVTSVVFYDLQGRITDINQKNQEMFGIKKEDYIGKTHFDILPEAIKNPEWFEKFWNDLRQGVTREKDYYINELGIEMWLHETFIPLKGEKGYVEQIINIGIDITDQKLMERRLDEIQKNI